MVPPGQWLPAGTPALAGSTVQNQLPTSRNCARARSPSRCSKPPHAEVADRASGGPRRDPERDRFLHFHADGNSAAGGHHIDHLLTVNPRLNGVRHDLETDFVPAPIFKAHV